jgi:hypothetical protein
MPRRLRLEFEEPSELRAEYDRNIANGGAFVAGVPPCELREIVEVELVFAFSGDTITLEAEVVHVVPGVSGCDVAVQFLCEASVLRERLAPLLPEAGPAPRAAAGADEAWELDLDAPSAGAELGAVSEPPAPAGASSAPAPRAPARQASSSDDEEAAATRTRRRERRSARRGEARIPARLAATHVELDGRTRDLSETGVLISADASELPVGKPVALSLRHPETGERVQVAGRVSRHVEGEGAVAAVAIAFEGPRDDPALAAFVKAARESEARRRRDGIRGRVEELGMASLLQMLCQSSRQGTLTVQRAREEGVVAFEAGRLRYARLGAARGRKALGRLVAWPDGDFVFHSAVDPLDEEDEPAPLEMLLLDAARELDETRASGPGAPALGPRASFRLDREALAACDALSKIEEAVVDLAAAGFTVRRMLDVIPEDDGEIRRALASLLEKGVVLPVGKAAPGEGA